MQPKTKLDREAIVEASFDSLKKKILLTLPCVT